MNKLTTTEDMMCSFIAHFKKQPAGLMAFKSIELADLRSRFHKLGIRCRYSGSDVIFSVENYDEGFSVDNNFEVLALQQKLKKNPVFIEQDFILMFCMAILREPERKLTLKRFEIERVRKEGKFDINIKYFPKEDEFVVTRKRKLILQGIN